MGSLTTPKRRTLIFGIDGGTWNVLDPLIERGIMPHLANLRQQSTWGELKSVIPVNSAAAWSSVLSGRPPEKHGIYDFFEWHPKQTSRTTVNATWIPRPNFLDILGNAGKLLALKIPMTYPAWDINGKMVSGLPTPDDESAFTYPTALATKLNPMIEKGSAGRSWELEKNNRHLILDQLERAHRSLERITNYLLEENGLQTCFVVARDVDELQHFFWDVLSGNDEYNYLPRIESYFNKIDHYLGLMLDWAGSDARIAIFSDHGFGPNKAVWHLNDWLRKQGFLALNQNCEKPKNRSNIALGLRLNFAVRRRLLRHLKRFGWKANGLERSLENIKRQTQSDTDLSAIDWTKTKAYTGNVGEEFLSIYINLRNREPFGIVDKSDYDKVRSDLIQALQAVDFPQILKVHKSEDLFLNTDGQISAAPDLIIETTSGEIQSDFTVNNSELIESSRHRNACHRRQGMYMLAGPDVANSKRNAELVDIPATILAWMGLPIPDNFTGQILSDSITGLNQPERSASVTNDRSEKQYLSTDDEAAVRNKLESLGYL